MELMVDYHQSGVSTPLRSIPAQWRRQHHDAVEETNPDLDALLAFLAKWELTEHRALGTVLTAGQLADVQELERLYALPSCNEP